MLHRSLAVAGLFLAAGTAAHAGNAVQFYTDPGSFAQALAGANKLSKATWNFKPDLLPPGVTLVTIDDVLDISTHPVNAPGVWSDAAGNDVWPASVDNVQFTSNSNPQQSPLIPNGPGGLIYAKPGEFGGLLNNNFLGAAINNGESFDIVSGPPAGDNHTAISFEMLGFSSILPPIPPSLRVTVYDKQENVIGTFGVSLNEGQKFFLGILADPNLTIGRIDIYDLNGGFEGISAFDLHQKQVPVCPWDCQQMPPPDKNVGVDDFLAVLAQWGMVGTSCDFGLGPAGVGVDEFLKVLAHWGQCPTPPNDECLGATAITRASDNDIITEHFDMYGATPSPDPYKCLPDPPTHKDSWYCVTNLANVDKLTSVISTVPLTIEINDGCTCPTGPLLACGFGVAGTPPFLVPAGGQFTIRLVNDQDLPNDQLKGDLIITNEPVPPDGVNFYLDPADFDAAVQAHGKEQKLLWSFKPHVPLQPGQIVLLDDFLDINTHSFDPDDPWFDPVFGNLWPDIVDNLQFTSNLNPQGSPLQPLGHDGLGFGEFDNNILWANEPDASFDIISGPPAGDADNHTAIAVELASLNPNPVYHVTVYDKSDNEMGKFTVTPSACEWDLDGSGVVDVGDLVILQGLFGPCPLPCPPPCLGDFDGDCVVGASDLAKLQSQLGTVCPGPQGKTYLGIVTKDNADTIGRVDIWDINNGQEGISMIEAWYRPGGGVNFYTDLAEFEDAVFNAGKVTKLDWSFKPDYLAVGTVVKILDPLNINTHQFNAQGVWDDGVVNLWPPEVDNITFLSNGSPQGPLTTGNNMLYFKGGPGLPIDNNALVAQDLAGADVSLDILSGPPQGTNHTAFLLELMSLSLDGTPQPATLHVTVYDKNETEMGKYTIDAFTEEKNLLGIVMKNNVTIGRIDIWDEMGGQEGLSRIVAYFQDQPANDCTSPGVCGAYTVCGTGTPFDCACYEVDGDPAVGQCIQNFLCADVSPCPAGGGCPAGFVCVTGSCCGGGTPVCVPVIKCDSPLGPKGPTGEGLTGTGRFIRPKKNDAMHP